MSWLQEEEKEWHEMDPSDRPLDFIPRKFDSLRQVSRQTDRQGGRQVWTNRVSLSSCAARQEADWSDVAAAGGGVLSVWWLVLQVCGYKDFVKERFERCLDLYLCPRAIRKTVDVDPDR